MKPTNSRVSRLSKTTVCVLVCALFTACVTRRVADPTTPGSTWHPPAQSSVHLVLQNASGAHFDLADHRGKALLVAAITTDNLMSQALVRDLERLAQAHDPADLAVVAVIGDTAPERDMPAILESYAHVVGLNRVVLASASDEVRAGNSDLGEIEHVPVLYFINRAGVMVRRIEGHPGYAALEGLIAPALPR